MSDLVTGAESTKRGRGRASKKSSNEPTVSSEGSKHKKPRNKRGRHLSTTDIQEPTVSYAASPPAKRPRVLRSSKSPNGADKPKYKVLTSVGRPVLRAQKTESHTEDGELPKIKHPRGRSAKKLAGVEKLTVEKPKGKRRKSKAAKKRNTATTSTATQPPPPVTIAGVTGVAVQPQLLSADRAELAYYYME